MGGLPETVAAGMVPGGGFIVRPDAKPFSPDAKPLKSEPAHGKPVSTLPETALVSGDLLS
jgi:hypothetical protein